jgi:hypothetical protein
MAGVGEGFPDVPQRNTGVQDRGDERVPQSMQPHGLGDPGPADNAPSAMPVQPTPIRAQEQRSSALLTNGQARKPRWLSAT